MIHSKKVLAIIPARFGSKGLPGKNLRLLGGKPLVSYPINTALNSKYVDHVYCSTDSSEIADLASEAGADTSYLRPKNLALDTTSSVEVVLDAIAFFESSALFFDFLVMLEPTSPMTEADDLDAALEILVNNESKFDNAISISESVSGHPHFTFRVSSENKINTFDGSEWTFRRRQDLEKLFFQTGSLYISKVESLKRNKSFITDRTLGFEVPKIKSFEIDDLIDFKILEMLMLGREV